MFCEHTGNKPQAHGVQVAWKLLSRRRSLFFFCLSSLGTRNVGTMVKCEHSAPIEQNWFARKKQPSRIWPERPLSAASIFGRIGMSRVFFCLCRCMFVVCLCCFFPFLSCLFYCYFRARGSLYLLLSLYFRVRSFLYLYVCAPASPCFVFCISGCHFVWGPARSVNFGDANPIVQSRLTRKGNKQTLTDKRRTSGVGPAEPCAQVGNAQYSLLEIQHGTCCDTHLYVRLT